MGSHDRLPIVWYGDVDLLMRQMAPHPWMALLADCVLGEAASSRGNHEAALKHATAAATLLRRYPDAGILRRRVERLVETLQRVSVADPLTQAERRVLEFLPTHLTEKQMAERLVVSRNTVKTHLRSVYRKLEVTSRAEAVQRARDAGLLPPE